MIKSHDKMSGKLPAYIFALLFISGVTIGTVAACFYESTLVFDTNEAGRMSVFINSFKSFLKPCMFIWVSGFTGISVYISALTLAYRGGIFGFVICMIIKTYGLYGGLFKAILVSLPQNIIYFPFLLLLCLAAAGQDRKKNLNYLILLALSLFVCAISALIDAHITSILINLTL